MEKSKRPNFRFDSYIVNGWFVNREDKPIDIDEVLSFLNERERLIVRMRYGIGYDKLHTLKEISDVVNVCPERVRQLILMARRKMSRLRV